MSGRKKIAILALTKGALDLGTGLAQSLNAAGYESSLVPCKDAIRERFRQSWQEAGALVCIMATGIVVRQIAPLLQDKRHDPAVLVLDERGDFVISLLSGHIGGANALARQVAALTGGQAVLTTSSDVQGLTALDLWCQDLNLVPASKVALTKAMGKLADQGFVRLWNECGLLLPSLPPDIRPANSAAEADLCLTFRASLSEGGAGLGQETPPVSPSGSHSPQGSKVIKSSGSTLKICPPLCHSEARSAEDLPAKRESNQEKYRKGGRRCFASFSMTREQGEGLVQQSERGALPVLLHPKILCMGIGCNRGTPKEEILTALRETLNTHNLARQSLCALASIDLKADEAGLLAAAEAAGLPLLFFGKEALNQMRTTPSSGAVFRATGAYAVAEPAALLAAKQMVDSGTGLEALLLVPKMKWPNVTTAVARVGLCQGRYKPRKP